MDHVGDFPGRWPDVLQVDRLAILGRGDRVFRDVDVHVAGDGIGDDQRRRGEIVGAHVGADAALEVAVAREHRDRDEIILVDRFRDFRRQRTGVADARGAAIADEVEAERVEIFLQAGRVEVFRDDLRTGRQRGLDPGFARQAEGACLAGDETGGNQNVGVRGVGARRDRGDDDRAVIQHPVAAFDPGAARTDLVAGNGSGRGRPAFFGHFGFLQGRHRGRLADAAHVFAEDLRRHVERDMVLRTFRPGNSRDDIAEIEVQRRGVDRRIVIAAPEAVLLGIGLDERDAVFVAAGLAQVAQRLVIDREEAAGRAIFRRHVGDGGAVGERHVVEAGAVEFDELVHDAVLAQHLHDLEHQVGRGDAFLQRAGDLEADDFRDQHRDRLAQHGGFGFDPADAPAEHGEAVDHGRVRISADQRVRVGDEFAFLVRRGPDRLGEVFEVHLVTDACAGRHDAEIVERLLAPFEEGVALHVALVFEVDVGLEGAGRAELVNHHRVVDHEVDRHQRVDLLGVAAECLDAVAHRGEVDHGGHAGEVLHQHAGRTVGDFARVLAALVRPFAEGADIVFDNRQAILEAQHVFEQHFQRRRQPGHVAQPSVLGRCGDRIIRVALATGRERAFRFEAVF